MLTNLLKVTKANSKQVKNNVSDYWFFNWLSTEILVKKQYEGNKTNLRVFNLIIYTSINIYWTLTTCQEFKHQDWEDFFDLASLR